MIATTLGAALTSEDISRRDTASATIQAWLRDRREVVPVLRAVDVPDGPFERNIVVDQRSIFYDKDGVYMVNKWIRDTENIEVVLFASSVNRSATVSPAAPPPTIT